MKLHEKIKEFNKLFNSFSDDAKKAYFKNFSLEFTHDSTAIEGNTIGYQEMRVLLDKGIVPGGGKTIAEVNEILGFAKAFDLMLQKASENAPISEDLICQLHELVMYPAQNAKGYRDQNAWIYGSKTKTDEVSEIYQDMRFLMMDLKDNKFKDPLEKAAYLHAELVRIHPFTDGNGRTCRLVMNMSLLEDDWPPINIKNKNRKDYISALEEFGVNKQRVLSPFYDFLRLVLERQIDEFLTNDFKLYVNSLTR